MSHDECFNRTSLCIWVKETPILAIEALLAKVTIILPPIYVHTVDQLLPGTGRMVKALWDRSETWVMPHVLVWMIMIAFIPSNSSQTLLLGDLFVHISRHRGLYAFIDRLLSCL